MTADALIDLFDLLPKEQLLSEIDIEFCRFLRRLESDIQTETLLAAALTSAAYREGNVCINLGDYAGEVLFQGADKSTLVNAPELNAWISVLEKSPIVGSPGEFRPLILDDAHRLYLQRHWKNEQQLVSQILKKAMLPAAKVDTALLKEGLNRFFKKGDTKEINWQKISAAVAVLNSFTVISGGPGTGKTTTVVRLLALLLEQARQAGVKPSIALAAPTGKAAARLETSIREALQHLQTSDAIKERIPTECRTIHQLLGARLHSAQFRFNKNNPLPYDYILIDEVSMVDQALMSRLMNATLEKTRVLLLGDKDQLASVEAGSVLGDICGYQYENLFSTDMQKRLAELDITLPAHAVEEKPKQLTDHIILLQKSYRFETESGIGQLAEAINRGEGEYSLEILHDKSFPDVTLVHEDLYAAYLDQIVDRAVAKFKSVAEAESPREIFHIYSSLQLLSPHRRGPWGVDYLNRQIEEELEKQGLKSPYENWYLGKPIIINENSYSIGLSNGDMGIYLPEKEGNARVYFQINDQIVHVRPSQLPAFSTAFVLTVHKSQGAEFDEVLLVLPDKKSKVLSRELLYTAITRAKRSVQIFGSEPVLLESINHKIARNSGLKNYLWG